MLYFTTWRSIPWVLVLPQTLISTGPKTFITRGGLHMKSAFGHRGGGGASFCGAVYAGSLCNANNLDATREMHQGCSKSAGKVVWKG